MAFTITIVGLLFAGLLASTCSGLAFTDISHHFDEETGNVTVIAEIEGDVAWAYLHYYACTPEGLCGLPQEVNMTGGNGSYSLAIGPFSDGDQLKFKVVAVDGQGIETESEEQVFDVPGPEIDNDEGGWGIPGFETWAAVLAMGLAWLVFAALARRG